MKRVRKYLSIIKPIIYYYLVAIIFTLGMLIISYTINIILGLNSSKYDFERNIYTEESRFFDVLLRAIFVVIYYIWYRRLNSKDKTLSRTKYITANDLRFFLFLGFGDLFLTYGVLNLLLGFITKYFPQVASNYNSKVSLMKEGSLILVVLCSAILSPIYEELLFRGVILKKAKDLMPFYTANILQALLFAIIHMNWIQLIYTFPAGLLYGYLTYKYQSIFPSIFLHIFSNACSIFISNNSDIIEEHINISIWFFMALTLAGMIIFIISYFMMKRNIPIKGKAVEKI
ncbi:MAG: CPBP family intramembrane metalloprotease [Clostridiales bacterium]|nr:CPBP family intramembrane metalloprotease [Clostridiales bacterium]